MSAISENNSSVSVSTQHASAIPHNMTFSNRMSAAAEVPLNILAAVAQLGKIVIKGALLIPAKLVSDQMLKAENFVRTKLGMEKLSCGSDFFDENWSVDGIINDAFLCAHHLGSAGIAAAESIRGTVSDSYIRLTPREVLGAVFDSTLFDRDRPEDSGTEKSEETITAPQIGVRMQGIPSAANDQIEQCFSLLQKQDPPQQMLLLQCLMDGLAKNMFLNKSLSEQLYFLSNAIFNNGSGSDQKPLFDLLFNYGLNSKQIEEVWGKIGYYQGRIRGPALVGAIKTILINQIARDRVATELEMELDKPVTGRGF